MLREHGDALESDFQRVYQRDLLDLYRGEMSYRKAAVLAMTLPPGSLVWQRLGGPLAWSQEDYWNAAQLHRLEIANWQRSQDGEDGVNQPEPVEPPKYEHERTDESAKLESQAEWFKRRQADRAAARQQQQE